MANNNCQQQHNGQQQKKNKQQQQVTRIDRAQHRQTPHHLKILYDFRINHY